MDFPFFDFDKDFLTSEDLLFLAGASGSLIEATATGNPATFTTDKIKPLVSLVAPFTPIQAGSGDPSPDNVRAISGFTGVTAYRTGKNLFDKNGTIYARYLNYGETERTWKSSGDSKSVAIPVKGNTQYTLSGYGNTAAIYRIAYLNQELPTGNETVNVSNLVSKNSYESFGASRTFTTDAETRYVILQFSASVFNNMIANMQLEVGQTATDFESYTGATFPVSFPDGQTIYGGSLDLVSGVLTVTHNYAVLNDASLWKIGSDSIHTFYYDYNISGRKKGDSSYYATICSYVPIAYLTEQGVIYGRWYSKTSGRFGIVVRSGATLDLDDVKTAAENNEIAICYELATPQTVQLDPVTIQTLIGNNTVWTDTNGTNTVVYLKKA